MSNYTTNRVSHGTEAKVLRINVDATDEQRKAQEQIVRCMSEANALLEKAAGIAKKAGLPFEYAVMTHGTRDEWMASEDCYGTWDAVK